MALCYLASVALIVAALWNWGAVEVRGHREEVGFLTFLGIGWMLISATLFSWFGLSIADDVFERRNPAALLTTVAAVPAVALIYAAGNLGEGPSYWNNIFSEAIGTVALFILWLIYEIPTRVSLSITEERDIASGIRFGGWLLATGFILARAIAGDWHSEVATVHDLVRDGYPAAVLLLIAIVIERLLRPRRAQPTPGWFSCGMLPSIAYLIYACLWLIHLGRWEGMPR